MREILLANGRGIAVVDDEDFDRVGSLKWWRHQYGYAIHTDKRAGRIRMHRLILDCPPGMVIDHIDGNPLNNRRANLRVCTQAENIRNSRPRKNKASPYRGVSPSGAKRKPWQAHTRFDKKQIALGRFETQEAAALAYDAFARAHLGPFARFNFPREGELPHLRAAEEWAILQAAQHTAQFCAEDVS